MKNKKFFDFSIMLIMTLLFQYTSNICTVRSFAKVEETTRSINLGMGGINKPTSTSGDPEYWMGSRIYFGLEGTMWRVLNDSGFMFSEEILDEAYYNVHFINSTWEKCTLRSYLNGYAGESSVDYSNNNFISRYFTEIEQNSILTTHLKNEDNKYLGGNDTDDKIFLLSLNDVRNKEYGFVNNKTRSDINGNQVPTEVPGSLWQDWWWLRTPGSKSQAYAASVLETGSINSFGQNVAHGKNFKEGRKVRPAFNLDTTKVLYTMDSNYRKAGYGIFGTKESMVESVDDSSNNIWKLTLRSTEDSLEVYTSDNTRIIKGQETIFNINHKSASSVLENASQVSAMLVNSNGDVICYGLINNNVDAEQSKIIIPSTLEKGKYTLKVFAEDNKGDGLTDYATEFSDINIEVIGVPVDDVNDIKESITVGTDIDLGGIVYPEDAENKDIIYSIIDYGETDAEIIDNKLNVTTPGVIRILVRIKDGLLPGEDYIKEFLITILPVKDDVSPPEEDKPPDKEEDVIPPDEGGSGDDDIEEVPPVEDDSDNGMEEGSGDDIEEEIPPKEDEVLQPEKGDELIWENYCKEDYSLKIDVIEENNGYVVLQKPSEEEILKVFDTFTEFSQQDVENIKENYINKPIISKHIKNIKRGILLILFIIISLILKKYRDKN